MNRDVKRRQLVLAALAVAAQLPFVSAARAGSDSADSAVPAGWVEVVADDVLSLAAPAGTYYQPGRGVDSIVGRIHGPDLDLAMDFGAYSDPLRNGPRYKSADRVDVLIDGRPAQLVTLPARQDDGRYFIGLHVPQVRTSALGAQRLTIMGSVARSEDLAVVRRIFASIRFRR